MYHELKNVFSSFYLVRHNTYKLNAFIQKSFLHHLHISHKEIYYLKSCISYLHLYIFTYCNKLLQYLFKRLAIHSLAIKTSFTNLTFHNLLWIENAYRQFLVMISANLKLNNYCDDIIRYLSNLYHFY